MNILKLFVSSFIRDSMHISAVRLRRSITTQFECNFLQYRLRNMSEDDIPHVRELRKGNNFYDAESCYSNLLKIDQKCFTVAEAENGSIIALGALKKITLDTYFVCFHVTHKYYRLHGVAREMLKHLFNSISSYNIIGNSDIGMLRRNMNMSFTVEKDFMNIEYEYDAEIDLNQLSSKVPRNINIDDYNNSHLEDILDYDAFVVGYHRVSTVTLNCQDPNSKTFVATRSGKCVGYGTIKPTIQGCGKVGPLYADDPAIAEAILKNLLVSFNVKRGLSAQTLSSNFYANMIFGCFDKKQKNILPSYRLYNKRRLVTDPKKIYAVLDGEYEPF